METEFKVGMIVTYRDPDYCGTEAMIKLIGRGPFSVRAVVPYPAAIASAVSNRQRLKLANSHGADVRMNGE